VVTVRGMAQNPFVFFVEGIHGRPGKRDPRLQLARVGGKIHVLPGPSRRTLLARPDGVPGCEPELAVPGRRTRPALVRRMGRHRQEFH
jgi:hypothetical protein